MKMKSSEFTAKDDIEVFFKTCKSFLKLGTDGLSYDALTAHTAFVFLRYMFMSSMKMKSSEFTAKDGISRSSSRPARVS
jgi:hypothetical protein